MTEQPKENDPGSFGRKLLSFFIQEPPESSRPTAGVPAPPVGPAVPAPAPRPASGAVDTKFIDHFATVLEKTNLQGPDYFEFRETLKNLSNLGLSEEKQYQAAWASFKALGGVGEISVLTNTAGQYLAALNADRDSFLKSVDNAIAERVGGLQNEQKQLQNDNEALARQIAELQNRVNANTERLARIGGEIEEQSQKLNQSRQNYEATYASFVGQIKGDLTKIGDYLRQ